MVMKSNDKIKLGLREGHGKNMTEKDKFPHFSRIPFFFTRNSVW